MTTDETKAPLPDDVRDAALKALHDLESNDYWRRGDFSDCHDKIRAYIAAREAEIELQKDLRQRAQDITDRSLARTHHYETLAAKSAANVYALQEANQRLREALYRYSQFDWSCVEKDVGHGPESLSWLADIANEALAQVDGKAGE